MGQITAEGSPENLPWSDVAGKAGLEGEALRGFGGNFGR